MLTDLCRPWRDRVRRAARRGWRPGSCRGAAAGRSRAWRAQWARSRAGTPSVSRAAPRRSPPSCRRRRSSEITHCMLYIVIDIVMFSEHFETRSLPTLT